MKITNAKFTNWQRIWRRVQITSFYILMDFLWSMYQRTSSYLCSKMKQAWVFMKISWVIYADPSWIFLVIEINQQLGRITSAVIQDNKMELEWNDKLCDPSGATLTIQVHAINFQNGNINLSKDESKSIF